jgi:tRNA 2-thiouridine synthesizing protein A
MTAGAPGRGPAAGTPPVDLDLRGEVCPYTFLRTRLALERLPPGALLRVLVDNETSARDVPRSLANAGHEVLTCEPGGAGAWLIVTRKGGA